MNLNFLHPRPLVLIIVLLISCTVRKSEPLTQKAVLAVSADSLIRLGQTRFMTHCHKCHPGGEAGLGPSVLHKPGFAKRLQVRHGLGTMPSFNRKEISKQELDAIIKYLAVKEKL